MSVQGSRPSQLRRVEGQLLGLGGTVEDDAYCIDVLTQVSAATRAQQAFSLELLNEHPAHCVLDAPARGGQQAEQRADRRDRGHRAPGAQLTDTTRLPGAGRDRGSGRRKDTR